MKKSIQFWKLIVLEWKILLQNQSLLKEWNIGEEKEDEYNYKNKRNEK